MKIIRLVALAIWLASAGFASAIGQTTQTAQANLQLEYDRLFQQMLGDPSNMDIMFEFAALANNLENYEAAIGTLERMLLINPDLPRVKLELGALYFRLASYTIARRYFADARTGEDVPPEVVERVQSFLDQMEKQESRHQLAGWVTFGARYQTNANAGPSSSRVRALGFDATLEDEFLNQEDWNAFATGVVTHTYDLKANTDNVWETTVLAYYAKQIEQDELDLGLVEVTTGPRMTLSSHEGGDVTARIFGLANFISLDDRPHFVTGGGGVDVLKPFGDYASVSGLYVFRYKDFFNSDEKPNNDDLTSQEHTGRAVVRVMPTANVTLRVHGGYVHEDALKTFNSNREWVAGAIVTVEYDAPFGITGYPWVTTLAGTYIETDYLRPDPSVDPAVERFDEEWRASLTNTVGLAPDLFATVQVLYLENDSNLPNFVFENLSILVSATKAF